jgi:hypothetical protein
MREGNGSQSLGTDATPSGASIGSSNLDNITEL